MMVQIKIDLVHGELARIEMQEEAVQKMFRGPSPKGITK